MDRLRLDGASLEAKTRAWTLFMASLGGLAFAPAAARAWGAPAWLSLAAMLMSVLGVVLAILMARRVRCPSCTQPMLYRFAPTWIKAPRRSGNPDVMCCPHCYEEIDVSGGASPPSNDSLQADRVR
jgi:hypothetical protein